MITINSRAHGLKMIDDYRLSMGWAVWKITRLTGIDPYILDGKGKPSATQGIGVLREILTIIGKEEFTVNNNSPFDLHSDLDAWSLLIDHMKKQGMDRAQISERMQIPISTYENIVSAVLSDTRNSDGVGLMLNVSKLYGCPAKVERYAI